jgi:hypothetical protein
MVTSTKSVARKASAIVRRKFFPPIAAAVALAALAAPSASAARTTGTGSESAAACPDGTLLAAVSAQRLPAGATAYKYDLPNGTSFENIAPPSGFNDVTASSALLSELNMPRRPAGAAAMKAWEAQVAPFARSGISGSEKFCEMAHAAPEPEAGTAGQGATGAVPQASVGHSGSTTFSGYELQSGPYHRATGHFTQPRTDTLDRSMSTWIGLNSNAGSAARLIQAGAGNEIGGGGGSPFWEQYCSGGSASGCNSAVIDESASARPGDTVSINVVYNGLTAWYQVAINGTLVINATDSMQSGSETGGVADFMTERTAGDLIPTSTNITFSALATYAVYGSNTSVPFGSQNNFSSEMTTDGHFYNPPCSANSRILMFPANVTSGGFVNNYCRSS